MGRIKKVALAGVLALAVAAVIAPSAGANVYPQNDDAKRFKNGPGGYTASESQDCLVPLPPLTCPALSNFWAASGGVGRIPPDGYITTRLGAVAGVAAESTGVWRSPLFKYRGDHGGPPSDVLFKMRSRSDVDQLLGLAGNSAEFTVEIVRDDGLVVATPWNDEAISDNPTWTKLPRVVINNAALELNEMYRIRITTTYVNGVDVLAGARADYDNVIILTK